MRATIGGRRGSPFWRLFTHAAYWSDFARLEEAPDAHPTRLRRALNLFRLREPDVAGPI